MAAKTSSSLFICGIFSIFCGVASYLDLEELNTINYGIDILSTPVVKDENTPPGAIYLTSKYGQSYQCTYPDKASEQKKAQEEEKVAVETGISELLRPMESGPCLIHSKGWWSYEFCYGKQIRQYHLEEGKISGNIISLGVYESEFDWGNATEKTKNRLNRYHSQRYVNGSECDLTGKLRSTEVRFMCEEGQGDYLTRVDEPETCVYVITVHTMKICHHPYLKPAIPATPVPITCNPLLTEEQYNIYMQEQEEEKKRKHEEMMQAYKDVFSEDEDDEEDDEGEDIADGIVDEEKEEESENVVGDVDKQPVPDAPQGPDDSMMRGTAESLKKLFSKSLNKGLQDLIDKEDGGKNEGDLPVSGMKFKVVHSMKDLEKFMSDTFTEARKMQKSKTAKELERDEEEDQEEPETSPDSESEPEGQPRRPEDPEQKEEDEELLNYFDKELDTITENMDDKDRLHDYKDNIQSAMNAQFENIVDEAARELEDEGFEGEIDRKEAIHQLAKTLNKLLGRLQKAEKDINNMNEEIEGKLRPVEEDDDNDDDDEDFFDASLEDPNSDQSKPESAPETDSTATSTEVRTDPSGTKVEETTSTDPSGKTTTTTVLDNRVRVRVTRVKQSEGNVEGTHPESRTDIKIPDKQKAQLVNKVKDKLQKAGLNTGGQNIEVKIITAGYYNTDDESLHILSDEDSSAFNDMVIHILGGNTEAAKEQKRHKAMEENYSFVFGQENKEKRKTSSFSGNM